MKCKICDHVTRTINAMRIHYMKEHPASMKRHKKVAVQSQFAHKGLKYCPHCGERLE